ncbi:type-F conjugative transfer system protein TraW [Pantoea sp. App145]|uniref:type-F conjugative transfer system protein TraW n=1 Tax=Pantoea sp. App145 TaxID=3071567 RepID=UPI003A803CED
MKCLISVIVLAAFSSSVAAVDLGAWGETWDIREHNLITVMRNNLQLHFAGQSQAEMEQEIQRRTEAQALRPVPVEGLITASETRTRLYDPAFTVTQDLSDLSGTLFARRGERVNPFDIIPVFDETLYFIDGDDARQIAWIQRQKPQSTTNRIILVNGNVRDSAGILGERVYFDQNGILVRKFGIKQIPAEVKQLTGEKLFVIKEYGLVDSESGADDE